MCKNDNSNSNTSIHNSSTDRFFLKMEVNQNILKLFVICSKLKYIMEKQKRSSSELIINSFI